MTRRTMREHTFKMLFQVPFYEAAEMDEQIRLYFDNLTSADAEADLALYGEKVKPVTPEEALLLTGKCREILPHIPELDEKITKETEGWKTTRFNRVDLAIVRLALYEMMYDDEVPVRVAINEAVELAKKFGGDESPQFVNGILARFVEGIEPAKE